ncbi:MAG: radical SAM protein [Pelagibacteraceae bacterium]|nr:radical SAM protein [Pelagibacteraceae bacterium]|tara:strand:+ start:240 stop:1358 length:1119 start_codon:yes stop_codon:yes gene_type:complete
MEKFYHPSGLRFLENKDLPFISLNKIIELSKDLKLDIEDKNIVKNFIVSLKKKKFPFILTSQEYFHLKRMSEKNWIKYLIYRYKLKIYPKKKIVSKFPVYLLVEPTSVCNLRCVMCFQIDKSFTKKPYMGFMDFNLFKKIIDEAANNGTSAITLASRGEPLLHPKISEMIKYVSKKESFIDIKLNTNATRLNEKLCHEILKSNINMVVVSIDSHVKKQYEEIRKGGKFDEVLKNIKLLVDTRKKFYKNSKLEIRVSGVKFKEDQNENNFRKFWSKIVDNVAYVQYQNRWNTYKNKPNKKINHPCVYLWERLYVWFDGVCNPCDADYKSFLSPGNLNNKSIKEVWNSDQLNKLRNLHISKKRHKYNPCDRCGL